MSLLVPIALFGWILVVLALFAQLPGRRAVVAAVVAGWLLLPNAAYTLSGLPDYNKMTATALSILLGTLLFKREQLLEFRPRWVDLPMLVWCLCPIASSLANGLGLYDGLSGFLNRTIEWSLPYLIGRIYLGSADGLRELAIGIVVGGLVYVLPCLYEIRMSPQLHRMLYGSAIWGGTRYGGYRPQVFLVNGLELGIWMTTASLIGYWLWASSAIHRIGGISFGWLLFCLLVVTVLCKSTGALVLLVMGIAVLWATRRTGLSLVIWALLLVAPLYIVTRTTGTWSGKTVVNWASTWINAERAESFEFRLKNEDILVDKALQRPMFGWGGWGRNRVYDEEGRDISVTDGLWIIALGQNGISGLVSFTAIFLLPLALLVRRYPAHTWRTAGFAPAGVLGISAVLYLIDCLSNGSFNPIYLYMAGGLSGAVSCRDHFSVRVQEASVSGSRPVSQVPMVALHSLDALANDPGASPADLSHALELAENAVYEHPESAACWSVLGAVCYRLGDWEATITALETAVSQKGNGASVDFYYLAMAHWHLGHPELARAWLHHAAQWPSQEFHDRESSRIWNEVVTHLG